MANRTFNKTVLAAALGLSLVSVSANAFQVTQPAFLWLSTANFNVTSLTQYPSGIERVEDIVVLNNGATATYSIEAGKLVARPSVSGGSSSTTLRIDNDNMRSRDVRGIRFTMQPVDCDLSSVLETNVTFDLGYDVAPHRRVNPQQNIAMGEFRAIVRFNAGPTVQTVTTVTPSLNRTNTQETKSITAPQSVTMTHPIPITIKFGNRAVRTNSPRLISTMIKPKRRMKPVDDPREINITNLFGGGMGADCRILFDDFQTLKRTL